MSSITIRESGGPGAALHLDFYPSILRRLLKRRAGHAVVMEIDGKWWSMLTIPARAISVSVLIWNSEREAVKGVATDFDRQWAIKRPGLGPGLAASLMKFRRIYPHL